GRPWLGVGSPPGAGCRAPTAGRPAARRSVGRGPARPTAFGPGADGRAARPAGARGRWGAHHRELRARRAAGRRPPVQPAEEGPTNAGRRRERPTPTAPVPTRPGRRW